MSNTEYSVTILPTIFGYSQLGDMYAGTFPVHDGEGGIVQAPINLIDVQYQIVAEKWLGPAGEWVNFTSPVVFDIGTQTIPFGLHLLIESYRNEPNPELLAAINENLSTFPFQSSMEGFVLQVSDIQ